MIRAIHDDFGADEYRPKREDESWFNWWRAYEHDVLGEDYAPCFEESRP